MGEATTQTTSHLLEGLWAHPQQTWQQVHNEPATSPLLEGLWAHPQQHWQQVHYERTRRA